MSQLILKYEYDESFYNKDLTRDDFGRLTLSVETLQFSGCGGFWVQWQDVVEFGESLAAFPITADAPPKACWSYRQSDGSEVVILNVMISPANLTGDLLVSVEIADDSEPRRRVFTTFVTHYPDLEAFGRSIARVMERKLDEAVLRGS